MDNSDIRGNVNIGNNVFIHENVLIRSMECSISIGNNTTVNRNTNILAQVTIGSNVSIAPNVVIVGMNHVFSNLDDTIKSQGSTSKGIIIEDDVWIATNVSILDGITIGKGSVIAAGAVVNKDVPPYSVMAGVPAKLSSKGMGNTKHYIWSAVDKFGTQIISFVSNILIARILSPDDYGLVAMLAIFTTIVMSLSDAGFNDGLIRKSDCDKKILEQLHRIILQLPYLCLQ